ncbi:PAS domain S-box protein [Neolewinella agarilytica]|uniref:PAS domain S-box protein n=1 Tax=Neolewinella agarilytica TaxID=478744 RepID=UPI002356ADE5|nr:PAS domain S-box protein [Neolewinella agarilytica]
MTKKFFTDHWAHIAHFSLQNAEEMIFWVREDGSFEYANPAAIKALGYTATEFYRLTASDILADYNEDERDGLRERIDTNSSLLVRAALRRKDGSTFPVESSNNSIVIDGKKLNCAFSRDISRVVAQQSALYRQQEILEVENENVRRALDLSDELNIIGVSRLHQRTLDKGKKVAQSDARCS